MHGFIWGTQAMRCFFGGGILPNGRVLPFDAVYAAPHAIHAAPQGVALGYWIRPFRAPRW